MGIKMDEAKKNVRMSSENTVGSVVLYNVHDRYPRMVVGDPENGMQKDYDDNKESVVDGGVRCDHIHECPWFMTHRQRRESLSPLLRPPRG